MLSLFGCSRNRPTPPHQTASPAACLAAVLPTPYRSLVANTIQVNVPSIITPLANLIASYIPLEPASEAKSSDCPDPIRLIISDPKRLRIGNIFDQVMYVNLEAPWEDTKLSLIDFCESKFPEQKVLSISDYHDNTLSRTCSPDYNSKSTKDALLDKESKWSGLKGRAVQVKMAAGQNVCWKEGQLRWKEG